MDDRCIDRPGVAKTMVLSLEETLEDLEDTLFLTLLVDWQELATVVAMFILCRTVPDCQTVRFRPCSMCGRAVQVRHLLKPLLEDLGTSGPVAYVKLLQVSSAGSPFRYPQVTTSSEDF